VSLRSWTDPEAVPWMKIPRALSEFSAKTSESVIVKVVPARSPSESAPRANSFSRSKTLPLAGTKRTPSPVLTVSSSRSAIRCGAKLLKTDWLAAKIRGFASPPGPWIQSGVSVSIVAPTV
jgi:hypothetical protein